jgi:hypothetical protein
MPNWVENVLSITKGDPSVVWDAIRNHDRLQNREYPECDDTAFDFNQLIPEPGITDDLLYRWHITNWGTKWNACYVHFSHKPEDNVLVFKTAWAPPVPIFEALAKKFPEHEIVIHSDEYGNHLHATFHIKNGEVTAVRDECLCFSDSKCDDNVPMIGKEDAAFNVEEPSG